MRKIFVALFLMSALLISGCGFVHDEHITGPYRLIAVDVGEQMNVCYDLGDGSSVGRIEETVFAYGFDHRYIVAMQHPQGDRGKTNYFILDMTKDARYADPSESVEGPLSREQFEASAKQFELPEFSRVIKYLK